jgi:hypothetical protein
VDAFTRSAFVAVALAAALQVSSESAELAVQQPPASEPVELRPGVVVDVQRRVAYVMNPKGGIDALNLNRGNVVWHTDQAARPVGVSGQLLVAQAEVPRPGNDLQLRLLDIRTGRSRRTVSHALPEGIRATVVGTAEGTFAMQAMTTPSQATLAWQFVDTPIQGVKPGALDVDAPAEQRAAVALQSATQPTAAKAPVATGVIRIDLASGKAAAAPQGEKPAFTPRSADVPAQSRVASLTGEQFASADGRHVMTSERIADDSVWEKYQWTVFETGTGRRLGTLRDYRSHAPFIVVGSSIIYETGPFERRGEEGIVAEPLRIRSVDLSSGKPAWSRDMRDTTYRGPLPG